LRRRNTALERQRKRGAPFDEYFWQFIRMIFQVIENNRRFFPAFMAYLE